MIDPLDHGALDGARSLAADYLNTMCDALPRKTELHALLMALAAGWRSACALADLDPLATFEQVLDLVSHGEALDLSDMPLSLAIPN